MRGLLRVRATHRGDDDVSAWSCPVPWRHDELVALGHGSGGRLAWELFERVFRPAFTNEHIARADDKAVLAPIEGRIAVSTDAFVIDPLFFPGGDIGALAVHGTVNDLAVGGAVPLHLTAAFILEEGLPIAVLERIATSMATACRHVGIEVVAGDTKVVQRGKGDKVFIVTTGIGRVPTGVDLRPDRVAPGDLVIVSGPLGDHGIAILEARGELGIEVGLASDSAPLHELARRVLAAAPRTSFMRDPTRGGLASTLNEVARAANVGMSIDEAKLPIRDAVRGACELLGLDPLYVANEGKLVAFVPPDEARAVLLAMRQHPVGQDATVIGHVVDDHRGIVVAKTMVGGTRVVDMLDGEQLPRIC